MRATSWVCGAVVALAVLGTSACGAPTVSVVPTGGSGSSACVEDGSSGSVCVGSDGTTAAANRDADVSAGSNGAGISAGSNGATITDGQGAGISVGPGGVRVSDGQGSSVSAGSDGVTSATGALELTGAVAWSGTVQGQCEVTSPSLRTITADLGGRTGRLVIDTTSSNSADVTLTRGGARWSADSVGATGGGVLVMDAGSTHLLTQLSGDGGFVSLAATFSC